MIVEQLYPILEFKMDDLQSRAFKLALIYEDLCREYFPGEKHDRLPKKGDPRKSTLFRHCYKMADERKNDLISDQYRLFIKAQFEILKGIKIGDRHANITPASLCGPKAWARWKVWLKKFNMAASTNTRIQAAPSDVKVKVKLEKTREMMLAVFKREPTLVDIQDSIRNRAMHRWLATGKMCAYYPLLSPFVQKTVNNLDELGFDFNLYKSHLTGEVENHFRKTFPNEF